MYYFELERKLFLHSSVHKEVSEKNNIDISKYIFVTDDMYNYFLTKRKAGYGVYAKKGNVLITSSIRPSDYHELDKDGNWFISEKKAAEKLKVDLESKLEDLLKKYSQAKNDIIFSNIMGKTKKMNILKKLVEQLENEINSIEQKILIINNNSQDH